VGSDGTTSEISNSPLALPEWTSGEMALHPNQQFLYLEQGFQDSCEIWLANADPATGHISAPNFANLKCPLDITIAPSGKFLILIQAPGIHVFAIGAAGDLTPVPGSPISVGNTMSADMDPDGKFVYVTAPGENKLWGFSMDATTGALTPLPGMPATLGKFGTNLDVSRRFVYVPNSNDNTLSVFRIDPATGTLTPVPGSPFPVGKAPSDVRAIDF
jgi:6-phosphogluconolactonase (cycloisomerase 2 family)